MESLINANRETNAHLNCTIDPKRRSFRRLLGIMNLVTLNCESALLSSDLEEIGGYLENARKHYAIMLRHAWRLPLSEQDICALETRTIRLEAFISRLEVRYAIIEGEVSEPIL